MSTKLTFGIERPLYAPSAGKGAFTGDDVLALKGVVSRAGFWPWQEFDPVYSERFAKGVFQDGKLVKGSEGMAGWQRHLGVQGSGNYGTGTHTAGLNSRIRVGVEHAGERTWDQYRINLYRGYDDRTAAEKIVTDIFSWWDWLTAREPSVHYSQARPIQPLYSREDPPQLPTTLDCSGAVIYMAWLADAKSPDVTFGYNGNGWTGSLIQSGDWISLSEVNTVAKDHYVLAYFGPSKWNTKHMTAVKSLTRSYSHGKEADPNIYDTVAYRHDFLGVKAYPVI